MAIPRGEDERLEPVLAREGCVPTMHFVSTPLWWRLRGGAGDAWGPARSPRGIRRGLGGEGRPAAMAESAPARVRVHLARTWGRVRVAELLAGAGLGGRDSGAAGGPGAAAGEHRRSPATPGLCPNRLRPLPRGVGAPAPRAIAEQLLRGLFRVLGFATVPTSFVAPRDTLSGLERRCGWEALGPPRCL